MSAPRYYRPKQEVRAKAEQASSASSSRHVPVDPNLSEVYHENKNSSNYLKADSNQANIKIEESQRHVYNSTKWADLFLAYGFAAHRGEIPPEEQMTAAIAVLRAWQSYQEQVPGDEAIPFTEPYAEFWQRRRQRREEAFRMIREEAIANARIARLRVQQMEARVKKESEYKGDL
ncbi:Fc.00g067190.m01.CDS01 [Cosmosporella sp. VM-42]